MQSSSEQPLVGEERYVTTLTTAAKETKQSVEQSRTKQLCVPLSSRQLQKDQETCKKQSFCWNLVPEMDEINFTKLPTEFPEIYAVWQVGKKEHYLLPETPVRLRNTTRSFSGLSLLSAISMSNSLLNSPCAMLRAFDWPRKT